MEKPLSSDSCAGLVGSEFGAGGIFAEGKNPRSLLQGAGSRRDLCRRQKSYFTNI
jgi:hypothetical protein